MTFGELNAFVDGMGIGIAPTPDQWARIKEKMRNQIDVMVAQPIRQHSILARGGMIADCVSDKWIGN